jgi:hypothetical protein
MAITDVFVPDVYFGKPGALIALPWPLGGLQRPTTRNASEFVTGSGVRRLSRQLRAAKLYELHWDNLRYDTYAKVEQYWLGHMGTGPWALVDPSSINLLTVNQSGATSDRNEAVGFSNLGNPANGTFSSNAVAAHIHRSGAPRSLRWLFAVTTTAFPVMEVRPAYTGWHGVPVVPGKAYTFSCWIKPDVVIDTSVLLSVRIDWRDANGTVLSEATSGDSTVTTWTRMVATGTAPAGAYYAVPKIVCWDFTITVGGSLYVDEFQLEMAGAVSDWRPGNGVYPVSILGLNDAVPFASTWRSGPQMVLREVA